MNRATARSTLRRRCLRAVDGFAIEAWKACRVLAAGEAAALAGDVRSHLGAAGGAVLAAAAGTDAVGLRMDEARGHARRALYLLYLARRVGALDLSTYRRLAAAHEALDRDLRNLGASEVQVVDRCTPLPSGSTDAR